MATKLAKPQLRGLFRSAIRRDISIGLVLGAISGVAFHYGLNVPKKERYAAFYRTYDPEKSYQRMLAAGVLDSPKGSSAWE